MPSQCLYPVESLVRDDQESVSRISVLECIKAKTNIQFQT
jgi:hypothetical protein